MMCGAARPSQAGELQGSRLRGGLPRRCLSGWNSGSCVPACNGHRRGTPSAKGVCTGADYTRAPVAGAAAARHTQCASDGHCRHTSTRLRRSRLSSRGVAADGQQRCPRERGRWVMERGHARLMRRQVTLSRPRVRTRRGSRAFADCCPAQCRGSAVRRMTGSQVCGAIGSPNLLRWRCDRLRRGQPDLYARHAVIAAEWIMQRCALKHYLGWRLSNGQQRRTFAVHGGACLQIDRPACACCQVCS